MGFSWPGSLHNQDTEHRHKQRLRKIRLKEQLSKEKIPLNLKGQKSILGRLILVKELNINS